MLILQRKAIKKRQDREIERNTSLITREKCDTRSGGERNIFVLKISHTLSSVHSLYAQRTKERRVTPAATAAAWICI